MTTVPGIAPTLWDFTVRDEGIVTQINTLGGQRVCCIMRNTADC